MTGFVMFLHALICVFLLIVILMQSGRGGGLTEGFASAESIFGAKTNSFMIKATTVLAALFLVTCLGLAVLSSRKGRSLMASQVSVPKVQLVEGLPADSAETVPTTSPDGTKEEAEPLTATIPVTVVPVAGDVPVDEAAVPAANTTTDTATAAGAQKQE